MCRYLKKVNEEGLFQFETPVTLDEVMKKQEIFIEKEFFQIAKVTSSQFYEERFYKKKAIREFNRYNDILTYKDTRVVLKQKSPLNNDSDYINACFIDVSILN